jgi:thiamine-monophosphate kinase
LTVTLQATCPVRFARHRNNYLYCAEVALLNENEIITLVNSFFPAGKGRLSTPFSHDAEVCSFNDGTLLFSTDEFSDEDLFPSGNPFVLGWNIASGAISDIIATGGIPQYYAHALTVGDDWNTSYLEQFCRGVSQVLKNYDVTFIGGDAGKAPAYRCTASVIGKPVHEAVGRKGASPGDHIFCSGRLGGGNFNAALSLYAGKGRSALLTNRNVVRFSILKAYGSIIAHYASSCVDTSDGCFRAIETLAEQNMNGYSITDVPLLKRGAIAAKMLSLPVPLLFLAECGEYELLFTVPPEKVDAMKNTAHSLHCSPIYLGKVTGSPGNRTIHFGKSEFNSASMTIRGRDFNNPESYLKEVIRWINDQ